MSTLPFNCDQAGPQILEIKAVTYVQALRKISADGLMGTRTGDPQCSPAFNFAAHERRRPQIDVGQLERGERDRDSKIVFRAVRGQDVNVPTGRFVFLEASQLPQ